MADAMTDTLSRVTRTRTQTVTLMETRTSTLGDPTGGTKTAVMVVATTATELMPTITDEVVAPAGDSSLALIGNGSLSQKSVIAASFMGTLIMLVAVGAVAFLFWRKHRTPRPTVEPQEKAIEHKRHPSRRELRSFHQL